MTNSDPTTSYSQKQLCTYSRHVCSQGTDRRNMAAFFQTLESGSRGPSCKEHVHITEQSGRCPPVTTSWKFTPDLEDTLDSKINMFLPELASHCGASLFDLGEATCRSSEWEARDQDGFAMNVQRNLRDHSRSPRAGVTLSIICLQGSCPTHRLRLEHPRPRTARMSQAAQT